VRIQTVSAITLAVVGDKKKNKKKKTGIVMESHHQMHVSSEELLLNEKRFVKTLLSLAAAPT
jgi:hypothetical protein